jgi:hypothetical protein
VKKLLLLFVGLVIQMAGVGQDTLKAGYSHAPSIMGANAYSHGNEIQLIEYAEILNSKQYYFQTRFIVPSSYISMYIPVVVN